MNFLWYMVSFPLLFGSITLIAVCPNAYVLKMLWAWFVAPTFNAPNISFAQAFGLVSIANLLQNQPMSWKQIQRASKRGTKKDLILTLGKPALILLTGWIAHLFL